MELCGEGTPISLRETPQLKEQAGGSAEQGCPGEVAVSWGHPGDSSLALPSSAGRRVTVPSASDSRCSGEGLNMGAVSTRQSQERAARARPCLDLSPWTQLLWPLVEGCPVPPTPQPEMSQ